MANNTNGKKLATQQSVNAAVKSICDIMRRSNCAGALQYVPELTWILFLRILDEQRDPRGRGSRGGRRASSRRRSSALPLAGLGRAGRREAQGAAERRARRLLRLRQRRTAAVPART